ncbi:hypothetical protein BC937DRAFT_91248 [Endogone sp. FLAS-F59071]|nr:hypothetical protein BC937DRAFT_91248 [Endogone sp. FLAS-F59071]|eukprot:RUS16410.1 hypothetical protein BC937DRAFT_91248 [Endogone sp. FLAS-F59071]
MDPAQQANDEETLITTDWDAEMDLDDVDQTSTVDTSLQVITAPTTSSSFASNQPDSLVDRDNAKVTPADEPKDVAPKVPTPREDTLHLHGTDDMNTDDVLGYFSEFGPLSVEWINDSSCK